MNVKEFFEKDDEYVTSYDFTYDILEKEYKKLEKNKEKYQDINTDIIDCYLIYKMDLNLNVDPDTNDGLLKDIIGDRWNGENLELCENADYKYYSDTMTSVQCLLNNYIKCCQKEKKVKMQCSQKLMRMMYDNKDEILTENVICNEIVRDFIKHYHTLGNYIPVPQGFNIARSGKWASYDMWDITLVKIKEYYEAKDIEKDDILTQLLQNKKKSIPYTKAWLDSFESWKNYVDKNYLVEAQITDEKGKVKNCKNYVDKNYDINKKLLSYHNFANPKIKEKKEYEEYFKEITEIIKGRSLIIKYKKNI